MNEYAISVDDLVDGAGSLAAAGATPMYIAVDLQPAGLIAVADALKPESRQAIAPSLPRFGQWTA